MFVRFVCDFPADQQLTCYWPSTVSHVITLITTLLPPCAPIPALTRLLQAAGLPTLAEEEKVYQILHCINYLLQSKLRALVK